MYATQIRKRKVQVRDKRYLPCSYPRLGIIIRYFISSSSYFLLDGATVVFSVINYAPGDHSNLSTRDLLKFTFEKFRSLSHINCATLSPLSPIVNIRANTLQPARANRRIATFNNNSIGCRAFAFCAQTSLVCPVAVIMRNLITGQWFHGTPFEIQLTRCPRDWRFTGELNARVARSNARAFAYLMPRTCELCPKRGQRLRVCVLHIFS